MADHREPLSMREYIQQLGRAQRSLSPELVEMIEVTAAMHCSQCGARLEYLPHVAQPATATLCEECATAQALDDFTNPSESQDSAQQLAQQYTCTEALAALGRATQAVDAANGSADELAALVQAVADAGAVAVAALRVLEAGL